MSKNCIVISLFNRVDLTRRTLEHIFDYSGEKFELFLYNDGSTDDTDKYIRSLQPKNFCTKIHYFSYDNSVGKAKRLNEFLRKEEYDFCSLIDNDVILPIDWLNKSIKILKMYNEVGIVAVNVEGFSGNVIFHAINEKLDFFNTSCIGGACLTFNKFFKEKIKILCEDYGRYGHEDAHVTHQMRKLNKLVVCLRDFGIHLGDTNMQIKLDKSNEDYINWKVNESNASKQKLLENMSKM
ncbi:MAG: hypothetical protein RL348_623 [Bacteroidota bacterium]|jgi:glycosyltransferase involved in cell wall biosynthesis